MRRESSPRPTKTVVRNLAPLRFCRYFADNDSRFIAGRICQRDVRSPSVWGVANGGFPCLKSVNSSPAPIERVRSAKHDLRSASRQKSANYLVRVLGAKLSISLVRSRVAVQVLERPVFHTTYPKILNPSKTAAPHQARPMPRQATSPWSHHQAQRHPEP